MNNIPTLCVCVGAILARREGRGLRGVGGEKSMKLSSQAGELGEPGEAELCCSGLDCCRMG